MARDLTEKQFREKCERYGFRPKGFLGYYSLPDTIVEVSVWNAGDRRRDQLAYLIQKNRELAKSHPLPVE